MKGRLTQSGRLVAMFIAGNWTLPLWATTLVSVEKVLSAKSAIRRR
jgi:hypothetical protein